MKLYFEDRGQGRASMRGYWLGDNQCLIKRWCKALAFISSYGNNHSVTELAESRTSSAYI